MAAAITAKVDDELLGRPAVGVRLQIYWVEPHGDVLLRAASTDADGTTATPLVSGPKLSAGVYRLVLHVGDYLQQNHAGVSRCFDVLPVVFVVEDAAGGRRVTVSLRGDGYAVRCS